MSKSEPPRSHDRLTSSEPSVPLLVVAALAFLMMVGVALGLGAALGATGAHFGPTGFDEGVTSWVVRNRVGTLTSVVKVVNVLGSTVAVIAVSVIAAGALAWRRRFVLAGLVVVASGSAAALVRIVKVVEPRARPAGSLQILRETDPAFPSGHATQTTVVMLVFALVVTELTRRRGYRAAAWSTAAVVAVLVGAGRVYLGAHWISDVMAGLLLGAVWVGVLAALLAHARRLIAAPGQLASPEGSDGGDPTGASQLRST